MKISTVEGFLGKYVYRISTLDGTLADKTGIKITMRLMDDCGKHKEHA
jgi:hypothetical protein